MFSRVDTFWAHQHPAVVVVCFERLTKPSTFLAEICQNQKESEKILN